MDWARVPWSSSTPLLDLFFSWLEEMTLWHYSQHVFLPPSFQSPRSLFSSYDLSCLSCDRQLALMLGVASWCSYRLADCWTEEVSSITCNRPYSIEYLKSNLFRAKAVRRKAEMLVGHACKHLYLQVSYNAIVCIIFCIANPWSPTNLKMCTHSCIYVLMHLCIGWRKSKWAKLQISNWSITAVMTYMNYSSFLNFIGSCSHLSSYTELTLLSF